jgi:transcriptional regulator with XRE-family HTH domain
MGVSSFRHSFFLIMAVYLLDKVLRPLLIAAPMTSWQQLADTSQISVSRLRQLRQGKLATWKIAELQRLSAALQISLADLLEKLGLIQNSSPDTVTAIDFQYASFQIIESFLTNWPVAAQQAKLDPTFPASKLLPLVGSIDRLIASWGITSIGQVGEITPFDPQSHQSLTEPIHPHTPVQIRYPGYRQADRLLTRAKVSPILPSPNPPT